jgi:nitroreductase
VKADLDGMELQFEDRPAGNQGGFDPVRSPYAIDADEFPFGGTAREQLLFLLRYAILAPSTHNTQPWRFTVTPDGVEVYADYRRRMTVVDPGNRELIISIGGALFSLRVAAAHFSIPCAVEYNLSGDSERPLAIVRVGVRNPHGPANAELEGLFPGLVTRHTNRSPFLLSRVPASLMERLATVAEGSQASVVLSTDGAMNQKIGEMVAEASQQQWADGEFRKDVAEWITNDSTSRCDGIPAAAYGWSGSIAALGSYAARTIDQGRLRAARDRNLCVEAPGLVVIASEDAPEHWLQAGEVHQRLCLTIIREGLQYSYFNMPVQIPQFRIQVKALLGCRMWPQLILRVGYCLTPPAPTPRRPLEDVMM